MTKTTSVVRIFLLGALLFAPLTLNPFSVAAFAAGDEAHDHDHDHALPPAVEELDDLFADEESHAGHDHEAHAGHGHGEAENGICPEHRLPEERDALCHGDHLNTLAIGDGMLLRLATPDMAARAGIRVAQPQSLLQSGGAEFPATVRYNRPQLLRLTPLAEGRVQQVNVRLGQKVAANERLLTLALPDMVALQGELRAALARQRQSESRRVRDAALAERGIIPRQELEASDAEAESAAATVAQLQLQLRQFGLSEQELKKIAEHGTLSPERTLRAPFAGTVVALDVAAGESVTTAQPLLTLAALDPLWLELALPPQALTEVFPGVAVTARFSTGERVVGNVLQIGDALDPKSRTLPVLAEIPNPDGRIKVGMYATARIATSDGARRLAVPAAAVQDIDGLPYLFLARESDLFEVRRIERGTTVEGLVPILAGLNSGESVVTEQGFALKAELLKARLGASCADH